MVSYFSDNRIKQENSVGNGLNLKFGGLGDAEVTPKPDVDVGKGAGLGPKSSPKRVQRLQQKGGWLESIKEKQSQMLVKVVRTNFN